MQLWDHAQYSGHIHSPTSWRSSRRTSAQQFGIQYLCSRTLWHAAGGAGDSNHWPSDYQTTPPPPRAAPRWCVFEKDSICINIQTGITSQRSTTWRSALSFSLSVNCCSSILLFDFHALLLNNVTQHLRLPLSEHVRQLQPQLLSF